MSEGGPLEPRKARVDSIPLRRGMNARHRVRPVLEPSDWSEFDPFLMLAEDWFVPGTFGDHPHRGFETVTLVLEGEVVHRDNHGGSGRLGPGDAQWMTAGRGVIHSEEAGPEHAHTLQLWLNLPAALKMSEPRYVDLRGDRVPVRREPGAEIRVFSGASGGVRSKTRTLVPITMLDMRLEAGFEIRHEVAAGETAFAYVVAGGGRFGAGATPAKEGDRVLFTGGEREPSEIVVRADEAMRAVFWSGRPLREPVAAAGPFVMNTRAELLQAFRDFEEGRF